MNTMRLSQNSEGTLSNFLDESLPDWYTGLTEMEQSIFNPLEILDNEFTVTFIKQNGTLRELTGYLFEKHKFNTDYANEYCMSLVDKQIIPMVTNQGWKSFNTTKVVNIQIGDK